MLGFNQNSLPGQPIATQSLTLETHQYTEGNENVFRSHSPISNFEKGFNEKPTKLNFQQTIYSFNKISIQYAAVGIKGHTYDK